MLDATFLAVLLTLLATLDAVSDILSAALDAMFFASDAIFFAPATISDHVLSYIPDSNSSANEYSSRETTLTCSSIAVA